MVLFMELELRKQIPLCSGFRPFFFFKAQKLSIFSYQEEAGRTPLPLHEGNVDPCQVLVTLWPSSPPDGTWFLLWTGLVHLWDQSDEIENSSTWLRWRRGRRRCLPLSGSCQFPSQTQPFWASPRPSKHSPHVRLNGAPTVFALTVGAQPHLLGSSSLGRTLFDLKYRFSCQNSCFHRPTNSLQKQRKGFLVNENLQRVDTIILPRGGGPHARLCLSQSQEGAWMQSRGDDCHGDVDSPEQHGSGGRDGARGSPATASVRKWPRRSWVWL